jgi:hypothetical protein
MLGWVDRATHGEWMRGYRILRREEPPGRWHMHSKLIRNATDESGSFVMRPAASSTAALLSLPALIFVLNAAGAFIKPSMRIPAAIALVVCVALLFWVQSYSLKVEGGMLVYSAPFRTAKRIALDAVSRIELTSQSASYRDWLRPPYTLRVHTSGPAAPFAIHINLKIFRREEVERLLRILKAHATR